MRDAVRARLRSVASAPSVDKVRDEIRARLWSVAGAPDVDASAAQAPGRARRRRLDEVADGDLLAILGSRLGAGEAARASSNHLCATGRGFRSARGARASEAGRR